LSLYIPQKYDFGRGCIFFRGPLAQLILGPKWKGHCCHSRRKISSKPYCCYCF